MARDWTLALALLSVLLTATAQISLKLGVSTAPTQAALHSGNLIEFMTRAGASPMVLVGLFLYAASAGVWLLVLARADVSYAYPFVSLGFVVIACYSYFFLQEPIGMTRLLGISLVVAGVWLVARS